MYERIREMMTVMMNSKVLESGTNISGRNYLQDGRDDHSKAFLRLCIIQAENKTLISFTLKVKSRINIKILKVTTKRRKIKDNYYSGKE